MGFLNARTPPAQKRCLKIGGTREKLINLNPKEKYNNERLNLSWTEKAITIKMNHVIGHLRNPDFSLPGNITSIFFESL